MKETLKNNMHKIFEHIRIWYPLYLFFFYPLSKLILAFFILTWRTYVDITIFTLCVSGISFYFLRKLFHGLPVIVTVILSGHILTMLAVFLGGGYLAYASFENEEFVENGQRYVYVSYVDEDFNYQSRVKYKVVGPLFRSSIPEKEEIEDTKEAPYDFDY